MDLSAVTAVTSGFLVAAGEYLREHHPETLRDTKIKEHFRTGGANSPSGDKLKTVQRASLAELDALLGSLQHRAFHGEL